MRLERIGCCLASVLAAAAAVLALAPASAQALGLTSLSSAPTNSAAGANSDLDIHIGFTNAADQVKDLRIGLPPGQVGDPNAAPQCSEADLANDACSAASIVGSLSSNVSAVIAGTPVPLTPVTGDLYNVAPRPGEPARFGAVLRPTGSPALLDKIILPSAVELRQTDFGLDTVIDDIPNAADTTLGLSVPIQITAMDIGLFGVVGTKPFLRNPTSCDEAVTQFTALSYSGASSTAPATGTASFTPTACDSLPFAPSFSATLEVPPDQPRRNGEKPSLTTAIDQAVGEAGLQDAKVFIPSDLGVDLTRLTSTGACSQADFSSGACPASAALGSASASSPLLTSPLSGPVYLLDNPGGLAKVGLDLHGQLNMRLQGQLGIDNTTEFSGLPDIPIAHFALSFDGGGNGLLLSSRDVCAPPAPVFHADFAGHNGATTSVDSPATVNCSGSLPAAAKCHKAKRKKGKHTHRRGSAAKKKHGKKKHKKKACGKKKKKKKGKKRR
jgi:hypothetical protein